MQPVIIFLLQFWFKIVSTYCLLWSL
jgi:hypothetical protein